MYCGSLGFVSCFLHHVFQSLPDPEACKLQNVERMDPNMVRTFSGAEGHDSHALGLRTRLGGEGGLLGWLVGADWGFLRSLPA